MDTLVCISKIFHRGNLILQIQFLFFTSAISCWVLWTSLVWHPSSSKLFEVRYNFRTIVKYLSIHIFPLALKHFLHCYATKNNTHNHVMMYEKTIRASSMYMNKYSCICSYSGQIFDFSFFPLPSFAAIYGTSKALSS